MSRDWRHSRGVRSRVHTTIEMSSTTSAALNHHEVKTWNTWARSSRSTTAGPEQRVVAGVDEGHREAVVGRRSGRRTTGSCRIDHPDAAPMTSRTMIWRTAKLTEVSRPQIARPSRRGRVRATPGDGPIGRDGGDDVP